MPNLVVKKKDGTTDVSFVLKRLASGAVPGLYSNDAAAAVPAHRPTLTVAERASGGRNGAQKATIIVSFPYTQVIDGRDAVAALIPFRIEVPVPSQVPEAFMQEAAAQVANLLKTAELQAVLSTGFAPRA